MPRRVTSLAAPHASLAALCFLALAAIALPSALALECDEAMTGFHDNDIKSQAWQDIACLLYTSPSPRDQRGSRMPSSA